MTGIISEKMYKFMVASANDRLPFILPAIFKNGSLHIEMRTRPDFTNIEKINTMISFIEKAMKRTFREEEKFLDFESISGEMTEFTRKYTNMTAAVERLNLRTEIIQSFTAFIETHPKTLNILSTDSLFFLVKKEHTVMMSEYITKYDMMGTWEEFRKYTVFFLISVSETSKNIIRDIVRQLGGREFHSEVAFLKGQDIFEAIENKKWGLLEGKRNFMLNYNAFVEKLCSKIPSFKFNMRFYREVDKFRAGVLEGKFVSVFTGWIPQSKVSEFETLLKRNELYFEKHEEKKGEAKVPSLFGTSSFLYPFEKLLDQYGITRYGLVNPLTFFAFFYSLLFGFMFADAGHGSVVIIFGLLFALSGRYRRFAPLLFTLGASSVFFGLMFGSVFGNESLIRPLLLSPGDNLTTILIAAIAIGILINFAGILLNIIQRALEKEYFEMLFGEWGVMALIFYSASVAFPVLLLRKAVEPKGAMLVFALILAAGITVKVLFTSKKEGIEEGISQGIVVSIWFIEFLSNTLSFIRVGAFLLAHFALSSAGLMMVEGLSIKGLNAFLFLFLWNTIVILLEGLVVFIQAMRLNYYEFFNKFFTADGIRYDPLKL